MLLFENYRELSFQAKSANLCSAVIHILPNISRSKGNQTMKFGQLIEYNHEKHFLSKIIPKSATETSLRPFSEKLSFNISLHQ